MEDNIFKNFAMIIPIGPTEIVEMKEDPLGAPIYRGCDAIGGCACTGRCQEVIGHSQDPEKIEAHRRHVEQVNKLRSGSMIPNYKTEKTGPNTWTWERTSKED